MPRDSMPAPTGPTNLLLIKQIEELRTKGYKENCAFMIRLADELAKPERIRSVVLGNCTELILLSTFAFKNSAKKIT